MPKESVYIKETPIIIGIPENTTKVKIVCTLDDRDYKVKKILKKADIDKAKSDAEVYTLTEEGREWLEGLRMGESLEFK